VWLTRAAESRKAQPNPDRPKLVASRPVALSDVMRTVAESYAPAAEESGRTLRAEIADDVQINGDRELLSQLFTNLVENALHHTPSATIIACVFLLSLPGRSLRSQTPVRGSPEGERAKVLRRFYRLDRSRTTAGSGLGLSTVGAIAELHHAVIELLDNQPGLQVAIQFPPA
jgi:signal transduction histidine kinase